MTKPNTSVPARNAPQRNLHPYIQSIKGLLKCSIVVYQGVMTEGIQLDKTGVMYAIEAVEKHSYRCVEPRAEHSALRTTRER